MITALGYIGLCTPQRDAWPDFASTVLGMEVVSDDSDRFIRLRMDEKQQRYLIERGDRAGLSFAGFEVAGAAELEAVGCLLEKAGLKPMPGSEEELHGRGVTAFLWVRDPDGHRVEFFYGLRNAETPFLPGKPIGGFRTGALGMGHIVLNTPNFQAMETFYRHVLGFRMSDFHEEPFPAAFMHVNERHHSLALIGADGPPRIHHLMCEYVHFDDVGRAYDAALESPDSIAVSLGRHLNDHVISFYTRTPDDFFIEMGWAGRLIHEGWVPEELDSPSLWGHVRYWLPEERRAKAREQIRAVGARGIRAPVPVNEGGGFVLPANQKEPK